MIFERFGGAIAAKNSMACYILQGFYLQNVPELFDFVATWLSNDSLIRQFLSPLWNFSLGVQPRSSQQN